MRLELMYVAPFIIRSESVYIFEPYGEIYVNSKSIGPCMGIAHDIGYKVKTDIRLVG